MEHYMSGAPLLADGQQTGDTARTPTSSTTRRNAETVAVIKDLLETRIRPAVAGDGGDITSRGFENGIVYTRHEGSCAGCPSSTRDAEARHPEPAQAFLPDVVEVRPM